MRRKIVKIDESKCNGCGLCVTSCAEGAIQIIDGKARVVSETYCDGLGACLGHCPQDAITIEERNAPAFDEAAAMAHMKAQGISPTAHTHAHAHAGAHAPKGEAFVCPGTRARELKPAAQPSPAPGTTESASELTHWPVQLKLVAPNARCFQGADLLLTADCVPFALPDFHQRFLRGKSVVIGCPKLDDAQFYVEKLADILRQSDIKSLTVLHMEVPCCFGLSRVAETALALCGKQIPLRDVTVSLESKVKSER